MASTFSDAMDRWCVMPMPQAKTAFCRLAVAGGDMLDRGLRQTPVIGLDLAPRRRDSRSARKRGELLRNGGR
jgi:hypothetical protein